MKPTPHYYHIQTPEGLSSTFICGELLPAGDSHVWLTTPHDNMPILRVRREYVTRSSLEETAARLLEDARAIHATKAPRN
jgi:hypothetical protein